MDTLRSSLHEIIQIELRQIKNLAMLGYMAPDEFSRDLIINMIMEEAGEAMFWNTVDAAYRGVSLPGVEPAWNPFPGMNPGPGMPGYGGSWPEFYSKQADKTDKDDKK